MVLQNVIGFIDFPENAPIRVLDLGCGTGNLLVEIIQRFPNASIYAVDFSRAMLDVAKVKLNQHSNIRFMEANIFELDVNAFPYFDVIVTSFVLHNYKSSSAYKIFFEKCVELLSVGGRLIYGDLIQYDDEFEKETEQSLQIEAMKKGGLSDQEISNWFSILDAEDTPLPVSQIVEHFLSVGFESIDMIKTGLSAVFASAKPIDYIQTKAELLVHGIRGNVLAENAFLVQNPRGIPKTGNNGIFIYLNSSIQVLVSFLHGKNQTSPYEIKLENGSMCLTKHERELGITITIQDFPDWYAVPISVTNGNAFPDYFVLEGGKYLHLAYKHCAFTQDKMCQFCSVGRRDLAISTNQDNDAETICAVLDEMFTNGYIPNEYHFCLGGGTHLPIHENVEFFSKIIKCIRKYSSKESGNNPIWVEMIPPKDAEIQRLIEDGATSFGFNIEVFTQNLRDKYCPGKNELASVSRYYDAFDKVTAVLGHNKVGSCVIVGLDTPENIMKGIDILVAHNSFPCILPLKFFDEAQVEIDENSIDLLERDFVTISQYAAIKVRNRGINVTQNEGCMLCSCCTIIHDILIY